MKLCFFMPTLAGGGAERVMLDLAEEFANLNYKVDLVVAKSEGPLKSEISRTVNLIELKSKRVITCVPALIRYLNKEKPNVVLSALAEANCLAVLARQFSSTPFRLILSEHRVLSEATKDNNDLQSFLLPRLMKWTYPKSDKIIAVSRGVAEDLSTQLSLSSKKIKVIYNPVLTPRIIELGQKKNTHEWLNQKNFPVILGAGRLTRQKDFPTLLKAFSILRKRKNAKMIILGDGEEKENLKQLANTLGVHDDIHFIGFTDNPYSYMRMADVFVLSSQYEGLGNVLIESMAFGTPVISTNCPSGPEEILENGKWGYLTPVGDPYALSKALDTSLSQQYISSEELKQRAYDFSIDKAVTAYSKVLLDQ